MSQYITSREVAKRLNVTTQYPSVLVKKGLAPKHSRIAGKKYYWSRETVDQYIKENGLDIAKKSNVASMIDAIKLDKNPMIMALTRPISHWGGKK